MYTEFFGLECGPFENTNNSRFFYPNSVHKEALAALLYGVKSAKGLILLTGEIGSGKSQTIQLLKEMVCKDHNNVINEVSNPKLTSNELIQWLLSKADINTDSNLQNSNDLLEAFNEYLTSKASDNADFRFVIIFDEAQLLSQDILEKIRLLSNLEFNYKKLVQIILIGQPELKARLDQYVNRPLMQRISIHKDLNYLDEENTKNYIRFRLDRAGCTKGIFTEGALNEIYCASKGSPRLINLLCDNSLFYAFSKSLPQLNREVILQTIAEMPASIFGRSFGFEPTANELSASASDDFELNQVDHSLISHSKLERSSISEPMKETEKDLFEIPKADTKEKTNKSTWVNSAGSDLWMKIFAFLVSVFILLWMYDFVQSSFNKEKPNNDSLISRHSEKSNTDISKVKETVENDNVDYSQNNKQSRYSQNVEEQQQHNKRYIPNQFNKSENYLNSLNSNNNHPEIRVDDKNHIPFPFYKRAVMFDTITVEEGYSVGLLAQKHYGVWNKSIEDIIKQTNSNLKNFSRVSAGYQLRLPQLSQYSLHTQDEQGNVYVYYASFEKELSALLEANKLSGNGYLVTMQSSSQSNLNTTRIYIGPFNSSKESTDNIKNIQFKFLGNM